MSAHPLPIEDGAPSAPGRTPRFTAALDELVQLGMKVARAVAASVEPEEPGLAPADPVKAADAFDRVSRAIRRTIRLAEHVGAVRPTASEHRIASRRQILRDVEDVIERRQTSRPDKDVLKAELLERIDGLDVIEDIDLRRPVDDIIRDICRDLGVASPPGPRPWKRRTPEDIADLLARAAAPPNPPTPLFPAALHPDGGPRETSAPLRQTPSPAGGRGSG